LTWINGYPLPHIYPQHVISKLLLAVCLLATRSALAAETDFTDSLRSEQGLLDLSYKGRPLLVYAFGSQQYKPYVRELRNLRGDNVLLDAPPDHLHHHGLMYAIRVNGVNFWEERDQPGYEKSVKIVRPVFGKSATGLPEASFSQLIHWVADGSVVDTGKAALLIEQRRLTVTVDEARQEVALKWHADFEVGPGASQVKLSGASYHGLGLRLPPAFNIVAQHQNSERAAYPTQGTGDVIRARWASVSKPADDQAPTIALFGQGTPERGLPSFFSMVKPFTYLAVTEGLDKAPIEHASGDKFSLDYLVLVYGERKSPEFLEERYQQWKR
jgi:hypothetical protein